MKPSAVLLIDLENFYCSREDCWNNPGVPPYDRTRFGYELDKLLGYARTLTADRATGAELPFSVRRAYADFNTSRYTTGVPPTHYLRHLPEELMAQGVEPVQVFRLSRGGGDRRGSKNAADMRMAMDATALLAAGHVEHFVLVTGDADFIPVILELKRHGHAVSVIGVTGATNAKIQRFVDHFVLFEDLLGAEGAAEPGTAGVGFPEVAGALRRLLDRSRPLKFAAVKPLLARELGRPFDPGLFACETTGEFLRKHQAELGVVIRQGLHDTELDLPAPAPSPDGTGTRSKVTHHPPPRSEAAEPHTAAHYRLLLSGRGQPTNGPGTVKVPAVPWEVIAWSCDAVVALLAPPTGEPTHTTSLLSKLRAAADAVAVPDLVKHVGSFYPVLRAGLPVQGADGVYSLPAESTGEQIRRSVLSYITSVLNTRLAESAVPGDVRPEALAAVFEPGAALERVTAEFAAVLAPHHDAEDAHTPANYTKLLKLGGAKGSDTEGLKVLPVPWSSVERVCADAFPVLSPSAGGGPVSREQLNLGLTAAGRDLLVEKYDQHVRRSLGLLRMAGELTDEHGTVTLNPDTTSAADLRNQALSFLLSLLKLRLEEKDQRDPIRPDAFLAAIEAGPLAGRLLDEVGPAIEWLYQPAESAPGSDSDSDVVEVGVGRAVALAEREREPRHPANEGPAEFSAQSGTEAPGDIPVAPQLNAEEPRTASQADAAPHTGAEPFAPGDLPTPLAPETVTDDEVILTAVPVDDWVPESDPLGAFAFASPPAGSPPPADPLNTHPGPVDRILPPPPPPPESA